MNEPQKKSYDLAVDAAKQQLSLAAAILALLGTFSKDVAGAPYPAKALLVATLLAFTASVFRGTRTLYLITATIASIRSNDDGAVQPITQVPGVSASASAQNRWFKAGIVLLTAFGAVRLVTW